MQKRKKTNISKHARQRLMKRVPEVVSSDYKAFVTAARYNGESIEALREYNPELAQKLNFMFWETNSQKIRVYKNCVFVFGCGHKNVTTLITIVNLNDNQAYDDLYRDMMA